MKLTNCLSITLFVSVLSICDMMLLSSCQQTTPQVPMAVMTPNALLSVRVNGQEWAVKGSSSLQAASERMFYASLNGQNRQELFILGTGGFVSGNSETDRLGLYVGGFTGVGTYPLGSPLSSGRYAALSLVRGNVLNHYITDQSAIGSLTITKYDTVAQALSGTFTFRGFLWSNTSSTISVSNTIDVTQGQFVDALIAR